MTGSYAKPRSGGKLRRNIACSPATSPAPTAVPGPAMKSTSRPGCSAPRTEGIIKTLNLLHQPGWTGSNYGVNTAACRAIARRLPHYGILNRDGVSGNSQNALLNPGTSTSNDYNCAAGAIHWQKSTPRPALHRR